MIAFYLISYTYLIKFYWNSRNFSIRLHRIWWMWICAYLWLLLLTPWPDLFRFSSPSYYSFLQFNLPAWAYKAACINRCAYAVINRWIDRSILFTYPLPSSKSGQYKSPSQTSIPFCNILPKCHSFTAAACTLSIDPFLFQQNWCVFCGACSFRCAAK